MVGKRMYLDWRVAVPANRKDPAFPGKYRKERLMKRKV